MSKHASRGLLKQSCAWIRDHWNAQNLDVPEEFLNQWIYNADDEEAELAGFQLAVFSFGYLQHDLVSRNVPPCVTRSVALSELLELFQAWQLKLALAEIHLRTSLRTKPLPLFSFSADERVEVWAEAPLMDS